MVTVGLLLATRLLRQSTPLALLAVAALVVTGIASLIGLRLPPNGTRTRPRLSRTRNKSRLSRTRNKSRLTRLKFEVTIHAEIGAFGTALGDDKLCSLPRIVFGYRHRGIVINPGMTADSWCFNAVDTHRRARVRMGITISRSRSFNRVRYRTGLRITLSYVLNNAVNTAAGTSIG